MKLPSWLVRVLAAVNREFERTLEDGRKNWEDLIW